MPFKKFNPCQPCCDGICEIGFYGDVINQVVNAFPNANGNANVNDPETINSPVWGESGNKSLDIFYYGYTFGIDSCDTLVQPFPLDHSVDAFAYNLGQFMLSYGGKVLCVAENTAPIPNVSVGCWEDDDVDTFNDFMQFMGNGVQRIAKNTNLDVGCQANTNVVTTHHDPFWQDIIDRMTEGVTQINMGGSTEVVRTPDDGGSLLMSVEDDTKAVIGIEKLATGYIMIIGDSNMFDSCIEGGTSNWGVEQDDGNFRTFLGNFCNL
ncbi:hypothetical protein [Gimesia maris]|uniref:hypothetical protein n=1 Tax=Gimesia maris TaxID=122 RepID=UPI0030DC9E28